MVLSIFWPIFLLSLVFFSNAQAETNNQSTPSVIPVEVGIRIHQIIDINEKKKNFKVVLSVKAKWTDPLLAYELSKNSNIKILSKATFKSLMVEKKTIFPAAIIDNQQGKSQPQNSVVTITPKGEITYLERGTFVIQATKFDFRQFPYDTQIFEIHLDTLVPNGLFEFKKLEDFSIIENTQSEEEWNILSISTNITNDTGLSSGKSRFTLSFKAERRYIFYTLKIFIPIMLIILVSWVTFFLRDYAKRIDLAGSNLLVFIAFNFSISNALPKLGYITFIDSLIVVTFFITTIVILINVFLRNLENNGRINLAKSIDGYLIWVYPSIYILCTTAIAVYIL